MTRTIAGILPQVAWQSLGVGAAGCTVLGMWLAWQRQWHRSDIEERLKERKITEEQAQRQIRFIEIRVAVLVCGGVALLIVALVNSV